ncbi:hypothetical protein HKBW3S44_01717, partial [Candidatus Hakubella thermalkaliphila]
IFTDLILDQKEGVVKSPLNSFQLLLQNPISVGFLRELFLMVKFQMVYLGYEA